MKFCPWFLSGLLGGLLLLACALLWVQSDALREERESSARLLNRVVTAERAVMGRGR